MGEGQRAIRVVNKRMFGYCIQGFRRIVDRRVTIAARVVLEAYHFHLHRCILIYDARARRDNCEFNRTHRRIIRRDYRE